MQFHIPMKNILLANLGNRNLKFNNKLYVDIPGSESGLTLFDEKLTFKDLTMKIWNLWKTDSMPAIKLEINILETFLKSDKYQFDKIYLVGSNQIEEKKQDQDTYWEALIIKKIIEEDYNIPSEVIECQKKVTDNNQLLVFFRDVLNSLHKKHPEDKFIICDAGGTAQQKSSLKIASEFLFNKEKFEVLYKPFDKDELTVIDHYEYRKIITAGQIISLIQNGNYAAARALLPETDDPAIQDLGCLLKFGEYRLDFLYKEVSNIGRNSFSKKYVPEIIADYKCHKLFCSLDYENIFGNNHKISQEFAFKTTELFKIAKFYLSIGNLSDFILALAIFIEQFFNSVVSAHTGIDITVSNQPNRNKVLNLIKKDFPNLLDDPQLASKMDIAKATNLTLPVTIALSKQIGKKLNHQTDIELIDILSKLNKNFMNCIIPVDDLRNDIAHRGEGVKPKEIEALLNENIIEKIDTLLGTQNYNPFDLLNQLIITFIKEKF
jgi:uncharacterized protein YutE (UPF0331/DUF86 family)